MTDDEKIEIIKKRLDGLTDDGMSHCMDYWDGYRAALNDILEMVFDITPVKME